MTCIIGLIADDTIYLGTDSAVSADQRIHTLLDKKIFKKGPYGVGFAGSLRVGQIIKYRMRTPTLKKNSAKNPTKILVINFVDAMRKALKDAGASREVDGREEEQDSDFIIAFQNRLFVIDSGYSVCEAKDKYIAIGSGADYALGSLYSTNGGIFSPEERIQLALEVSAHFCTDVAGPFEIIKIK